MKNLTILQKVVALIFLATTNLTFAQDDCATATNIADLTGVVCATSAPGTTSTLAAGSCEEGTIDTWFSFTAQGSTADVTVTSDITAWNPEFLVLESDDNTCAGNFTEFGCADQTGAPYETINGIVTGLTPGNVYWVVVSSNGDLTTGSLDVCVVNMVSPPNEDFCNATILTPDGSCLNGETNNGAAASWSGGCVTTGNPIVFYDITLTGTNTVLDIDLTTNAFGGGNVEMFLLTNDDVCPINNTSTLITDYCGSAGSVISFTALTPGVQYYLGISTLPANTGDFDICVTESTPPAGCTDNEDCANAAVIVLNASGSPGDPASCVVDCNTGAAQGIDFVGNICADMGGPTVWYQFTTDFGAATLDIDLTSSDFATPEFTIWANTCDPWTQIANSCTEGAGGAASVTGLGIAANTTYLISITDVNGGSGNFSLCIGQNLDQSLCNTAGLITETGSSDATTPVGGPYSANEVVSYCYTIDPWLKEGCNWLSGIIPTFGDCWDASSFDASGMPVTVTTALAVAGNETGSWAWFDAGDVSYNNIVGSLPPNTPLPAGWFFQCNSCGVSSPDPNLSWGDGGAAGAPQNDCDPAGNGYTWTVCFDLVASDGTNCAVGETDCSVQFKTYADGEIGGWDDIGCTGDIADIYPASFLCCPTFISPDTIVCDSFTLPTITGALLTGFETYHSAPDGGGIQYNPGDVVTSIEFPNSSYVYIYDGSDINCLSQDSFLLSIFTTPIVDPIGPLVACDSVQLPAITGTLTGAEGYYSASGGTGTTYLVGDWITVSMTMFAYDSTTSSPTCFDEESFTITINVTPTLTVQDTTTCSPNTVSLIDFTYWSTDIGVITYFESDGITVIGDPTAVGAGTYILSANNLGCITTAPVVVTVNTTPTLTVQDTTTCSPNTIDLTDATYWSTDIGTITYFESDGITVVGDPTTVGAGTYILSADNLGCITTAPVVVTVNTTPTLTVQDTTTCSPNTVSLIDFTYWSTDIGTITYFESDGITVIGDPTTVGAGTYILSANNLGCITTAPVVVTVNTTPTLTVQDTTTCSPNTIDLTDATYWSTDIGTITYFESDGITVVGDPTTVGAGTYVLSADNLGCITTATVVVTVNTTPTLTVQDTTTCSPNTVSLIDFTYWSTDIGVITYFESDGITVVGDPTMVGAGTYILSANNLGCIATAPVVVTVNASPVIAAAGLDPALCNAVDGEIEVTLSSGQTSLGVLDWTGTASGSNGSADITADSPDIIGLGAGSYNVTFTDANGCVSNTELIVLNNPFAPIIDPIVSIVSCADYDLILANVTGTDIDQTGALTFYTLTGGPSAPGQQVIIDQTFTAFTDTTIFVYDENGVCSSEIQFNITINTTPTLSVQDTITCSPSTVDLTDGAYWSTDVGVITYFESDGTTLVGDATAVGAGTYILSADNAGCITTAPVVITVNTTPTLSVQDTTTCSPNTVDLTDVTYWSTDVGTITFFESDGTTLVGDETAVGSGTYILSAENGGCITIATVIVTVNPLPVLTVQDTAICSLNTIDLTDVTYWSSDVGTITYFESDGTTLVGDATAVGSGTYILSAENLGCITTAPVVVTVTPLPVLMVQDTTTCSPNTIDLTDVTYWSTDVGTITYFESDGTTVVGDATAVGAGTYILSADNLGCFTTAPVIVTVTSLPALTVQDTTTCSPNTVDLTDATYWSTDLGIIAYFESDGTTVVLDATAVEAGTYILSVANLGCITIAPVVVTVNTTPTLIVQDTTTCSPNTIDLTDAAYWSTDIGTITYFESDGTTVVGDATAVGAGIVVLSADNAGCIATALVAVTVNTTPTLTVQDTTTCSPNTVDLTDATFWSTDVGTITYFESDGTTVVVNATAAGAGTYVLSADNAGCITTALIVVTINTTPTLSVQDTLTCPLSSIDLTDVTYWSTDVGTITYFESNGTTLVTDASAVGAGTYILSADNAGCIVTAPVVVTINTTPILTVQDTTTCAPNIVNLTDVTYWSTDVGTISYFESDGVTPILNATIVGAGTYVLSANNFGCIAVANVTVTVKITPTLTLVDPPAVCSPLTVDITLGAVSSTDVGAMLYYSDLAMTMLVPDATAVGGGTYYVEATYLGCSKSGPVTVVVVTTPEIFPLLEVEACDSFALPIIEGVLLTGAQNYFDATGGPSVANVVTGPITSSTTLFIYDGLTGCSDEETLVITINPLPTVTLVGGGGTYCEGDFVSDMLVDVTGTPNFTVDFTLDGVALSISGATSPLSLGNAAGVYIITNITDGNTCTNVVYEIEKIIVNPIPAAPAAGTDVVYCSTVTPDAMTVSGGLGTFTWYTDAGLTSVFGAGTTIDPSTALGELTYYVTETEFGCEGPASEVSISIIGCEFIIPTAFTPDGDLMNDDWEILDIDLIYPNNIVYVYNRWGSLLFKSKQGSYDSNRWNGKYNGNLLPVGSYYFIIDFNGKGNDKATGIVSIILNK